MSFSAQVKQEMMNRRLEKHCCRDALCFGAACFSYSFTPVKCEIHTESEEISAYLTASFAAIGLPFNRGSWWSHGRELISLSVQKEECPDFSDFYDRTYQFTDGAQKKKPACCPDCLGAWLAGAFFCSGTVSDPGKEYHLEFVLPRPGLNETLCEKLSGLGIEGHFSRKNGADVIYLRASEQIEDLLTAMGAAHCAMDIMNEKIYKNYRNQANRITNCETANIDKIVAANAKVLQAIDFLTKSGTIKLLPEPLQQAAAARRAYPDISLNELAGLMDPPVSKSGLSHRLKKLVDIAGQQTRIAGERGV